MMQAQPYGDYPPYATSTTLLTPAPEPNVFLVTMPKGPALSRKEITRIKKGFEKQLPGHIVLVVQEGVTVEVIR